MMSRPKHTTRRARKGVVLLVVLGLIMAITVLALGFLARSETEMFSGNNMALRMQMDQMAASALEHARGLIVLPPDEPLSEGYWTGATAQQLDAGSDDYYSVTVAVDASDHCNYDISCEAYRLENGERIGRSELSAELRLDPCIAHWLGATTALPAGVTVTGDLYCAGDLSGLGTVNGDVFAAGTVSGLSPAGRTSTSVAQPPVAWPGLAVSDYSGSVDPDVDYRSGDEDLTGNASITGALVINGDLNVSGANNTITGVQGLPALFISGDLTVEAGSSLTIEGLALIEDNVYVSADAGVLEVTGGMFVGDDWLETTADLSGNNLTGIVHGAPTWNPTGGQSSGALELDGSDDYVDCGNNALLAITTQITVAAWVKTNDSGNGEHNPFVTKGDRTYALKHNADNTIEFFIYDPAVSPKWFAAKYAVDSTFNDAWHHVAGTYDGNDVKLYVDGVLRDTNSHVGTIYNLVYNVNIGRNAQEPDRFYDGAIDEVRIYARALDASEVLQLHDSPGLAGDTTELRARYRFDDSGSSVTITADPPKTGMIIDEGDGTKSSWSQAGGAFFKSMRRP